MEQNTPKYSIPLEDIRSIMLEDRKSILTSALLSKLAEFNVALYTCDEKHLPNGVMLSYNQHSRALKVLQSQLTVKKPLVKRLWQSIVKRKIENQAACLTLAGCEGERILINLVEKVESGDRSFIESQAAKLYFKLLYGRVFNRRTDNFINAAMNYGYAIIRGQVARSLSAYGFLPSIGLQHHSEINNFNLADDLMEPYRPIVDLLVAKELDVESDSLSTLHKQRLYGVLTQTILLETQRYNLTASIDAMLSSFSQAITNEDAGVLLLPRIMETTVEVYE
jgi:CRISPR-associated protein Cas1